MRRLYILILIMLFAAVKSEAKTTNWTGIGTGLINGIIGGTDVHNWFSTSNWDNGVPGAGDIAQIGVNSYAAANYPIIDNSTITATVTNPTIGTLIFGVNTNNGGLVINVGYTLTVTGNTSVQYGNTSSAMTIQGTGILDCKGAFLVGDNTAPSATLVFQHTWTVTVNVNITNFKVGKDVILNTTANTTLQVNLNNPLVYVINGTLTVTGGIKTTNSNYQTGNLAQLIVNPSTTISSSLSTLSFGRLITLATGGSVDFYGPGPGKATTIYSGNYSDSTQTIYSTSKAGLDTTTYLYHNIIISGASPKKVQSGRLTVFGDWASSGANIDAITNVNTVFFQGTTQSLTDNGSHGGTGMVFNNVAFQGSGAKTISAGNFSVSSTGILSMAASTSLATGGNLILLSSAAGSATVSALPKTASITGNVKVQRFIKGSSTDLSKRGYRLISSPVYTYTTGGVKYFDVKYLLDSAYVSGASGGGFNVTGNPSLYLYREDVNNSTNNFTAGNWKGIAQINNPNAYDIGTQKRLTTTNTADTLINLAVGNGVLFFFRGNKTDNATQSGSKTTSPYDYPEDVVFTQTGQLNTGTIDVKQWYKSPSGFSFTAASNVSNSTIRGFVFVGNPYPSTINFEKFNRQGANSSIYGGGFPAASDTVGKIWVYNPTNKQYETYMQAKTFSSSADTTSTIKPTGCIPIGDATNMIASGQGFFIKANNRGRSLSFRESAKTSTLPAATNLNRLMDMPGNNMQVFSSAPVNVTPPTILSMLSFKLSKDSINTDNAVLVLNNKTTAVFNDADDAEDMNGNGAQVSLSIMSSDSVATSIKQVKLPISGQQRMRLLVDALTSGKYNLNLANIQNMPGAYDVWLMDGFTKDSLDLKHNTSYDFNIDKNNAATFGSGRFSVVVRLNPAAMMHTLSVTAAKVAQGAKVNWRTENEGVDYTFSVEKSVDGKNFTQIGQLNSNGGGNYTYTDVMPTKGINYYKLKLEDMALSTISYSSVMSLNYTDAASALVGNISIYPNPASSIVNIKMSGTDTGNNSYSISITSSTGRLVKQVTSSTPYLQTSISDFMPGTYMVQIVNLTDNKLQGQTKFVKL